jgi:hypothetical protein
LGDGVRVYIVLPDLGDAKYYAIRRLGEEGVYVNVLVSYTILKWKPSTIVRLIELKDEGYLGSVMLDSGAYHMMRL